MSKGSLLIIFIFFGFLEQFGGHFGERGIGKGIRLGRRGRTEGWRER